MQLFLFHHFISSFFFSLFLLFFCFWDWEWIKLRQWLQLLMFHARYQHGRLDVIRVMAVCLSWGMNIMMLLRIWANRQLANLQETSLALGIAAAQQFCIILWVLIAFWSYPPVHYMFLFYVSWLWVNFVSYSIMQFGFINQDLSWELFKWISNELMWVRKKRKEQCCLHPRNLNLISAVRY